MRSNLGSSLPCALSLDPAFCCYRRVLGETANRALLFEAITSEPEFTEAAVTDAGKTAVNRNIRASRILTSLGEAGSAAVGSIVELALITPPLFGEPLLQRFKIDARLLHYGDGDFFAIHRDAPPTRRDGRLVSFVYQFFREPAAFTGGALRLFGEHTGSDPFIDIKPENDLLTVFRPSTPHEVLPVRLSRGAFSEGRFAINGWLVAD